MPTFPTRLSTLMFRSDSLDKIVLAYFAAVTTHPFVWHSTRVEPKAMKFGPALLRGFTCPAGCGGCCPKFTLDYLPQEPAKPFGVTPRVVEFDGRPVRLFSDMQPDNDTDRCRNLNLGTGRCGIHGKQPFSCDFELIRFFQHDTHWTVREALFGRGWNMRRTNGGRGALCTITDADAATAQDVARRLDRLTLWADHFGLRNHRARPLADYCRTNADDPQSAPTVEWE